MNGDNCAIYVEGPDDRKFIEDLLKNLEISGPEIKKIGGGVESIARVATNIQRDIDAGRKVAVILDADQDIRNRRNEAAKQFEKRSLPLRQEQVFLLPDNSRCGSLETLLEELTIPEHRTIFDCLDAYGACLKKSSKNYFPPPGKGRIYAYCEALGVEPNGSNRDYLDSEIWDFKAPRLKPLSTFLCSLSG